MPAAAARGFGAQLKHWRGWRGCSQQELAARAGYSQRHLSFLESGRARPSRHTVLVLADALDVPLAERNGLLHAAGFAPAFSAAPLASEHLQPAAAALHSVLAGHRPFPALLVDRRWNMFGANPNALALFARFTAGPAPSQHGAPQPQPNALRQCLDRAGLRPFIRNWPAFAALFARGLRRELAFDPGDAVAQALLDEIECDAEFDANASANSAAGAGAGLEPSGPVALLQLERDGVRANLFTMVSTFSAPLDVTLAELRIETFFPADDATRALLTQIDDGIDS